jgi:hypothetical protein
LGAEEKKIKKQKVDSGRKLKVTAKKECLFFIKSEGKGKLLAVFNFFKYPLRGPDK